jgi:hypothetical protein
MPTSPTSVPDSPEQIRAAFKQAVETYNAALATGKVRTIRPAVLVAHETVFALYRQAEASHPDQADLIEEINAAFMDIRWGRAIPTKSDSLRHPPGKDAG